MIKRSEMASKMIVPVGVSKWTRQQPLKLYNQIKNDASQCLTQPSKTLHEQRKRLGKCYKYSEKYNLGH